MTWLSENPMPLCLSIFELIWTTGKSILFEDRFLAGNQLYDWFTHRRGWWGCWGPKKSIAIFAYKQRILSIEMKTKVVQHVKRDIIKEFFKFFNTQSSHFSFFPQDDFKMTEEDIHNFLRWQTCHKMTFEMTLFDFCL